MGVQKIEHIGIAVQNLSESIDFYEKILGLTCYAVEEVPDQQVRTAFFRVGKIKIELLESTSPDGPIAKHIAKKGPGLHHLAFAVDDLQDELDHLKAKGIALIDNKPRKGAEDLNIAFLHPKSTLSVLTELCEEDKISAWGII